MGTPNRPAAPAEIEAATLDGARRGDADAWASIVRSLGPRLRGYARGRGARDPDAVLQEVLMAAAEHLGDFVGGPRRFRSWLFSIAYRKIVDDYRRSRREMVGLPEETPERAVPGPEGEVLARDGTGAALEAMHVLGDTEREVILLRVIGGLETAEVADAIGTTRGNVRVIQSRAMAKLRAELAGRGYVEA